MEQIYDDLELQERLTRRYRELPTRFPGERIEIVSGEASPQDVHRTCLELVRRLRDAR
jgi:thymidylate kinase